MKHFEDYEVYYIEDLENDKTIARFKPTKKAKKEKFFFVDSFEIAKDVFVKITDIKGIATKSYEDDNDSDFAKKLARKRLLRNAFRMMLKEHELGLKNMAKFIEHKEKSKKDIIDKIENIDRSINYIIGQKYEK